MLFVIDCFSVLNLFCISVINLFFLFSFPSSQLSPLVQGPAAVFAGKIVFSYIRHSTIHHCGQASAEFGCHRNYCSKQHAQYPQGRMVMEEENLMGREGYLALVLASLLSSPIAWPQFLP